jgi:hypothetical protein
MQGREVGFFVDGLSQHAVTSADQVRSVASTCTFRSHGALVARRHRTPTPATSAPRPNIHPATSAPRLAHPCHNYTETELAHPTTLLQAVALSEQILASSLSETHSTLDSTVHSTVHSAVPDPKQPICSRVLLSTLGSAEPSHA